MSMSNLQAFIMENSVHINSRREGLLRFFKNLATNYVNEYHILVLYHFRYYVDEKKIVLVFIILQYDKTLSFI